MVNLYLQRGEAWPAEDEDDAETGEAEYEDQERRCADGRGQQWQRHLAEGPPPVGSQQTGGLPQLRVEIGPVGAYHAQHERVVVEHVRQQDNGECVLEVKGRLVESQESHQGQVEQAVRSQQRGESQRDDDGG